MLKLCGAFLLLLIIVPSFVYANYQISPIRIIFPKNERVVSLYFTNNENEIRHFQLSLFKLELEGFQEVLVPSKDLLITPIMFDIERKVTQLIRVAQRKNGPALTGKYKLSIKELPRHKPNDHHHIHLATEFFITITFEGE